MNTFGTIKTKIEHATVNLYGKPEFKSFMRQFKSMVLENKDVAELYYIYDDLSSKKGLDKSIADDYLNESVEYSQVLIENNQNSLSRVSNWIDSVVMEHKNEYSKEISDIVYDIQAHIDENNAVIDAEVIRAVVVLSQMNLHIWHNETNYRKGIKDGNNLELTHGLNGIRNTAKNKIQEVVGGRKDYKIDCIAADFKDWEVSWPKKDENKG